MLDPWISYDGIQKDYNKDANLLRYLEDSMMSLHKYFNINYAMCTDMQRAFTEQPHTSSSTGDVSVGGANDITDCSDPDRDMNPGPTVRKRRERQ